MKVKKSSVNLYNEILEDLRGSKDLSKILPSVLMLSKKLGDKELEKWTGLELNGYYKNMEKNDIVPEYRIVPGQYHDIYGRPLFLNDSKLAFINQYRLRNSISELEKFSQSNSLLSIQDLDFIEIIRQNLKVEVYSFSFSPTSVTGVIQGIKTNLINKLMNIEYRVEKTVDELPQDPEHTKTHYDLKNLHPLVQSVASQLYTNGHYRQAILDTYIAIVDTVKIKSGRRDLDGVQLMQTVFSPKNPIILISDDPDEQLGFMWMFTGAVMGIRNPKSHKLTHETDPQRAMEWLSYASALLRVLDEAEVLKIKK